MPIDHGDEHGELHESPLDPADDARIRRLLAEARHTEPMPAAVVARLDRVLTGLASERAPIAPVIDLARRRRTATKLLVAAAAVVVAGVGVGQVLPGLGTSSNHDAQETTADGGGAGGDAAAPKAESNESARAPSTVAPSDTAPFTGAGKPARIRSDHFGPDLRRLQQRLLQDSSAFTAVPGPTCLSAPVGSGTVLAATYNDAAAAVVLRPPAGDTQVVDLYLCGHDQPLRSITLTAP